MFIAPAEGGPRLVGALLEGYVCIVPAGGGPGLVGTLLEGCACIVPAGGVVLGRQAHY